MLILAAAGKIDLKTILLLGAKWTLPLFYYFITLLYNRGKCEEIVKQSSKFCGHVTLATAIILGL